MGKIINFLVWPAYLIQKSDWYEKNLGGSGNAALLFHFAFLFGFPIIFWLCVLASIMGVWMALSHQSEVTLGISGAQSLRTQRSLIIAERDYGEAFRIIMEWCKDHGIHVEEPVHPYYTIMVHHNWEKDGHKYSTNRRLLMVGPHHVKITNDFPGAYNDNGRDIIIKNTGIYTYDLADPADWDKFCKSWGVEPGE